MTIASWLLLAVAGVFAVADWIAVHRRSKPVELVCKPAAMVALIGAALVLDPTDGAARNWFVVAFVLSLAGDVFLMVPASRASVVSSLFIAGLASFLVGHLLFVVGMWTEGVDSVGLVAGAVLVLALLLTLGRRILAAVRSGRGPSLVVPVAAYIGVISAMVVSAVGLGEPWAVAGAALFYGSDALIAWNRFVAALTWAPVTIMVTYHLAQAALLLSLTT
ncbi:lysoplasmalogenase [soil metagenome]